MSSIHRILLLIFLVELKSVHSWLLPAHSCSSNHCRRLVLRQNVFRLQSSNSETIEDVEGEEEGEEDTWEYDDLEVLQGEGNDFENEEDRAEWVSDAFKAQQTQPKSKHLTPANEVIIEPTKKETKAKSPGDSETTDSETASAYTEEEEELIEALGGKGGTKSKSARREDGFLGDCTLQEIATDYSVPICYLADVLCMWEVPVPINRSDRLGDLVTGEQAFALVEAVNSLDIGALQDRYSNQSIMQVCDEWNISIKDAFEFAMKEGWSLPFGVRTNLRVEQEDELLRVLSTMYRE